MRPVLNAMMACRLRFHCLVATLLATAACWAQAATLQLEQPTLGRSAAVKVRYAQIPTQLSPGQMVQLRLMRLEGGKEDQVYVRRLDTSRGNAGMHDFGPAYFPGRYEVRLVLVAEPPRELARVALEVVPDTAGGSSSGQTAPKGPSMAPPAPIPVPNPNPNPGAVPKGLPLPPKTSPPAAGDSTGCTGVPAVSGAVPPGAPTPAEVAASLRGVLSESYAPVAGSAADVCVAIGTLSYRGQQDRKMLSERTAPVQAGITSWVVATSVTITIHKRHGTEVRQRGGSQEVFLFFRDRGRWGYRTGRP